MLGMGAQVVFLSTTVQISIEIREGVTEITEGVTEIETLTRILQWLTCPHLRTMLPQLSQTNSFRITPGKANFPGFSLSFWALLAARRTHYAHCGRIR
jgi:hypothetical protein